jgi:hypothetical protein
MSAPAATRSASSNRGMRPGDRHPQGRPAARSAHRELERAGSETTLGQARVLGSYQAETGLREVLALERPDDRTLVLDVRRGSPADARVIAVLFAEEPVQNAALLAHMYVSDPARGRPRELEPQDLLASSATVPEGPTPPPTVLEARGACYEIAPCTARGERRELRWTRVGGAADGSGQPVTLRDVVGALEDYEPPRSMTSAALRAPWPGDVGRVCLSVELSRVLGSPIVLNRGLREAVEREVRAGASMSEIATRCGRLKGDRNGNRSGETSWLARRIGQMPEAGRTRPTPWVHSDTLALIARRGLGLSPREVEL